MRLAVSVIGWEPEDDDAALALLGDLVDGVEAAPQRIFGTWASMRLDDVRRWREDLEARGLACPAMQALLYGTEGLSVTGDAAQRRETAAHLRRVAAIAGACGARVAVFGSVRNRLRGSLSHEEASERMRETLLAAADAFAEAGAVLAVEAIATEHGADFLTTYEEVGAFVDATAHDAIRVHLDTAALRQAGEAPDFTATRPSHVHLSAPGLAPFTADPAAWHAGVITALAEAGYDGWLSIEQRPGPLGLADVEAAIAAARSVMATAG